MFSRSTRQLAETRRPEIEAYIKNLLKLPAKVSQSEMVTSFFTHRATDPVAVSRKEANDDLHSAATTAARVGEAESKTTKDSPSLDSIPMNENSAYGKLPIKLESNETTQKEAAVEEIKDVEAVPMNENLAYDKLPIKSESDETTQKEAAVEEIKNVEAEENKEVKEKNKKAIII